MVTMKCTSCGETVLSTDKFCKQCGKSIEQIAKCTSCGETVLSTDKFCKQCGKPNVQTTEQATEQKTERVIEQTTEQKTETAVAAENPNKKEKEKFKLYSLRSIVAATFLGTPLAGGILIRKNSLNLGRKQEGLIALIVGIVATILLFVIPIDGKITAPIIPLIFAGITYLIVRKMHGKILKMHKEEGGEFYSHWKALRIALICTVIFVAGAIAYYIFTDEDWDVQNNEQIESSIPQNKNEEVYQITAKDLHAAYSNNEVAADNKYTGKTLIVTGYISEINKDFDGTYYIALANTEGNPYDFTSICYFPAHRNSSLTSLQKGQFVSIKGRCIGKVSSPELHNCSLEVNTTQPQGNSVIDPGVVINGVKWATRNIDAPGTFAATPESPGKFYQWNRKKAWATTGNITTDWDSSSATGTIWEKANDPSPAGWRVPTLNEIEKLLDKTKVKSERTTQNGINGVTFTDKNTGHSIFLPAVGHRTKSDEVYVNISGYWSSTGTDGAACLVLDLYSCYWMDGMHGYGRDEGFSVRSVAD